MKVSKKKRKIGEKTEKTHEKVDPESQSKTEKPLSTNEISFDENVGKHSFVVKQLIEMGFPEGDAIEAERKCGKDVDKCMVWIVTEMEERSFGMELDNASIFSEESRKLEKINLQKERKQLLQSQIDLTEVFEQSVILNSKHENICRLVDVVKSTGNQSFRESLINLLELEQSALKWYKRSAACYFEKIGIKINNGIDPCHIDESASRTIPEFVENLKTILFGMPQVSGGVPLAFIEADESFDLNMAKDGFEFLKVESKDNGNASNTSEDEFEEENA